MVKNNSKVLSNKNNIINSLKQKIITNETINIESNQFNDINTSPISSQ